MANSAGIRKAKSRSKIERANFLGDIVTIKVGTSDSSNNTFHVHQNLIHSSSPFFKAAFKDEWKQADTRVLHLVEDDPRIFEHFVIWLYTGVLDVHVPRRGARSVEEMDKLTSLLLSIYIFADKIQINQLKDHALDKFMDVTESRFIDLDHIGYIYRNTLPECKMRSYLVDDFINSDAFSWYGDDWDEKKERCAEFYYELVKKYNELHHWDKRPDPHKNRCAYHEHDGDEPCTVAT